MPTFKNYVGKMLTIKDKALTNYVAKNLKRYDTMPVEDIKVDLTKALNSTSLSISQETRKKNLMILANMVSKKQLLLWLGNMCLAGDDLKTIK